MLEGFYHGGYVEIHVIEILWYAHSENHGIYKQPYKFITGKQCDDTECNRAKESLVISKLMLSSTVIQCKLL